MGSGFGFEQISEEEFYEAYRFSFGAMLDLEVLNRDYRTYCFVNPFRVLKDGTLGAGLVIGEDARAVDDARLRGIGDRDLDHVARLEQKCRPLRDDDRCERRQPGQHAVALAAPEEPRGGDRHEQRREELRRRAHAERRDVLLQSQHRRAVGFEEADVRRAPAGVVSRLKFSVLSTWRAGSSPKRRSQALRR